MYIAKRIFIVGQPGSGKGLLAKSVAKELGWKFIDADLGLEFLIGRGLSQILGEQGQDHFYECQFEILNSLCKQEHIVVATDASIVCSEKNRQLLENEFTVFLNISTPAQLVRTSRNFAPLLPLTKLEDFFNALHAERDGLYQQVAKLITEGDETTLEDHVQTVVQAVSASGVKKTGASKSTLDKKDTTLFDKKFHAPVHLTEQQAICLKLLAQGKSSKEIAREIHVSYRTVEGSIAKIMELLGCSSSKELIALYHEQP